jgi:3-oxoacyl-[acyl-carrier-protein] synthase-3
MVFESLGTRHAMSEGREPARSRLHFEGQAVFKLAVRGMVGSVERTLARAGLTVADVDLVIPHQANERIIDAAMHRLGVPGEKVFLNIADHGNTSAASVPMALADALAGGRISAGDVVLMTAFGGGLTWASAAFEWGDRVVPLATSEAELPEPEVTVFDVLAPNRAFFAPLHDNSE